MTVSVSFFFFSCLSQDDHTKGCYCPPGFKGDGVTHCEGTVELLTVICVIKTLQALSIEALEHDP